MGTERRGEHRPRPSDPTMPQDTTVDPTDRLGTSPVDHLYENAMLTILVTCFVSFWLVTAYVML